MRLKVVAVFDRALAAFSRPAFVPALGVAMRGFNDEARNPQSEISKHRDDYELFELGEWEDNTGEFFPLERPRLMCRAKDLEGSNVQK